MHHMSDVILGLGSSYWSMSGVMGTAYGTSPLDLISMISPVCDGGLGSSILKITQKMPKPGFLLS